MIDIRFYDGVNTPPYEVVVKEREKHIHDDPKVFDWVKAAKIIVEKKPLRAFAGLAEDWFWTSGCVYEDEDISFDSKGWTWLMSTWATPILHLEYGDDDSVDVDCFVGCSERPEWDERTYWPKEAVDVLVKNYQEEQ